MRITSLTCWTSTSTLLWVVLAGLPSGAQQTADPATSPAGDVTSAEAPPSDPATVSAHSKIRIVRLSEVKGEVQLDRNSGKGFETPMTNLPIVEGDKLKTGSGVAEVELEDNSTVRIGQDSFVEFPKLEMLPGGAKASAILVKQGTAYVNLLNTKGNEFTLMFGKQTLDLPPDSHIRLQLTSSQAELAVLHGNVLVTEPAGVTTVAKNKTMTFDLANDNPPAIAKNVAEMPLDAWDHDAAQYHKNFANATSFGNSPYSYGINDMNYYGSFIDGAGCGGAMWRPYFTSASWDPYGSGAWAYYPTGGYSWVSPYPWGWTPFHYGSWAYCQGTGWGWRPGGEWMDIANTGFVSSGNSLRASSGSSGGTRPRPPLHPPTAMQSSLVPVNLKAIPVSSLGKENTFVFRGNSAGYGVPRGSLGKLNSFSGQAASHGAATTSIYYGGAERGGEGGRAESGGPTGGSLRSGTPPASESSHSYSSSMQGPAGGAASHASGGVSGGGGGGGGGHR